AIAQDVPDRLPVNPGRLHRHMRAARRRQPAQQRLKAGCRCLEGPTLAMDRSRRHDPHTGNDHRLVDVQAGNPLMHDFHSSLLSMPGPSAWGPRKDELYKACSGDVAVPWLEWG